VEREPEDRQDDEGQAVITITTIPKESHRYDTVGDWQIKNGNIDIKVTDLKDVDYNFLLGLHELIEAYLCQRYGVTDEQVTAWDKAHPDIEPGDHPGAPYFEQHMFATKIEKLVAKRLNVKWKDYGKAVENA
jgi:hypothetical protein